MSQRTRPLDSLKFARSMTAGMLKDFPEAKMCFQPAPTDNHMLWSLGHMAATYTWMLSLLGQKGGTPEAYATLFGWGSKPTPNAKDYPPLAEVKAQFDSEFDRFVKYVAEVPEADLTKPLGEAAGGFAKDTVELIDRAAWHEGWHAGQMSSLRRALGLKGLMG
jgi:hypothetical protein